MRDTTICLTYFKSLTLANLAASLCSVRQQDLSRVEEVVLVDNDTPDAPEAIEQLVASFEFPLPVQVLNFKHGDPARTHAWSTNQAVAAVETPYVLFTRADYLLAFHACLRLVGPAEIGSRFVTSNGSYLGQPVEAIEATSWRVDGPGVLGGDIYDHTEVDSGVWAASKETFDLVGGLDESLTAWGHAQTEFQYRLHLAGVEFVRVPEVLFWHPRHGGERDLALAHAQLRDRGFEPRDLWKRYHGASPYA